MGGTIGEPTQADMQAMADAVYKGFRQGMRGTPTRMTATPMRFGEPKVQQAMSVPWEHDEHRGVLVTHGHALASYATEKSLRVFGRLPAITGAFVAWRGPVRVVGAYVIQFDTYRFRAYLVGRPVKARRRVLN